MTLAVLHDWVRQGKRPPRDVVFAFVADEEAGGLYGAHHLVDNHADLFEGCTEAISEVGGFSMTVGGKRLYAIQTAEKGIAWLRLVASRAAPGTARCSTTTTPSPQLAEAVARVGRHCVPDRAVGHRRGVPARGLRRAGHPVRPDDVEGVLAKLGPLAKMIGATVRHTANPTMLDAGYKQNVIPGVAHAYLDCRLPAGRQGAVRGRARASSSGRRSRSRSCSTRSPTRRRSTASLVAAMDGRDPRRGPGRPLRAVLHVRWHRREVVRGARHPLLRLLAAAAARRTWTSSGCSTASTSGCRSRACGSAYAALLSRFLASS